MIILFNYLSRPPQQTRKLTPPSPNTTENMDIQPKSPVTIIHINPLQTSEKLKNLTLYQKNWFWCVLKLSHSTTIDKAIDYLIYDKANKQW